MDATKDNAKRGRVGAAAALLSDESTKWKPGKHLLATWSKRRRGEALQAAVAWARDDKYFLRDLRRLLDPSKAADLERIQAIAHVVQLHERMGLSLRLDAPADKSAFRAAAAWISDPYGIDTRVTYGQAKKAYYDALLLGLIKPPEK